MGKIQLLRDFDQLEERAVEYLRGKYPAGSKVIVKIHFGEPGNEKAFRVEDIEPIIKALKVLDLKPVLVDTPVVYDSPRNSVEGYSRVVKEKGYDKLADFKIIEKYQKYKTKDMNSEVAKDLVEADNILAISHVKGHICSGFGGAIKNFGMGGVSVNTKDDQHTLGQPKWVDECKGCGVCAQKCPVGAIKMIEDKAKINLDACCGCSICTIECPHGCLAARQRVFDDLLAQAASSVINNLPENSFYINFIKNICQKCDCDSDGGDIIAKDIGVLFSDNPVAIDMASVDLVEKNEGKDVFKDVNNKDPRSHLRFAEEYTRFSGDYEMEEF